MHAQSILTSITLPNSYNPDHTLALRLLLTYVRNTAFDTLKPQERYWITLWQLGVDRSRTAAELIRSQTENPLLKLASEYAITISDAMETNGGPPQDIIDRFKDVADWHRRIETGIREKLHASITDNAAHVLELYRLAAIPVNDSDPLSYATLIYDVDGSRIEIQLPLRPLTDVTFEIDARDDSSVSRPTVSA